MVMVPVAAGCGNLECPTGSNARRRVEQRSTTFRVGPSRALVTILVLVVAAIPACLVPPVLFLASRATSLRGRGSRSGSRLPLRAEFEKPRRADQDREGQIFEDLDGYDFLDEGSGSESGSSSQQRDGMQTEAMIAEQGNQASESDDFDDVTFEDIDVSEEEVAAFLAELGENAAVKPPVEGGVPRDAFDKDHRDGLDVFRELSNVPQRRLLYERGMPDSQMMITLKDRVKQMSVYAEQGNWFRARYIMRGIWRRRLLRLPLGRIMWNLMIKAHMRANRPLAAESWINDMLTRVYQPDLYSYNTLLQGYARRGDVHKADQWMRRMKARGVDPDIYSYTAKVNVHVTVEDAEGAERAILAMEENLGETALTAVPYNALLKLFAQTGDVDRAEHWLSHMLEAKVRPDQVTHLYLLKARAKQRDADGAAHVLDRMQEMGGNLEKSHFQALMTAHGRSADFEGAEAWMRVMDDQGIEPDVFSYNIILSSMAAQGDKDSCLGFLERMEMEGLAPDVFSYSAVIQAHANVGDAEGARSWLLRAEEAGLEPDMRCYNHALRACAVAGNSSVAQFLARRVLRHSLTLEAQSYGSILGAFAKDGNPAEAEFWVDHMMRTSRWRYGLFSQRQISYAYAQVVAAYIRVGNTEAAEAWISQMLGEGVEPSQQCYAELVRGHLKDGRQAEAQKWCYRMSAWSNHKVPEELQQLCFHSQVGPGEHQHVLEEAVS